MCIRDSSSPTRFFSGRRRRVNPSLSHRRRRRRRRHRHVSVLFFFFFFFEKASSLGDDEMCARDELVHESWCLHTTSTRRRNIASRGKPLTPRGTYLFLFVVKRFVFVILYLCELKKYNYILRNMYLVNNLSSVYVQVSKNARSISKL